MFFIESSSNKYAAKNTIEIAVLEGGVNCSVGRGGIGIYLFKSLEVADTGFVRVSRRRSKSISIKATCD